MLKIPGGCSHQQIDSIADYTFQVISGYSIIRFQVIDNGLNRRAPSVLFLLLVFLVPGVSFSIAIGNRKAFLLGTYHGVSSRYLQEYLNELC